MNPPTNKWGVQTRKMWQTSQHGTKTIETHNRTKWTTRNDIAKNCSPGVKHIPNTRPLQGKILHFFFVSFIFNCWGKLV